MRASFSRVSESTQEDWTIISTGQSKLWPQLPDRILAHLEASRHDLAGYPVDRLQHALQTAHFAAEAGEDDEYVVCALLHDVGDTLGMANHADVGAAILEPFVSEANHWMVKHHAILQGYYFFHYLGLDRNMHKALEDHEHYDRTRRFVEKYDNPAFDASQPELSVELFEPMVRKVFASSRRSIYKKSPDSSQAGS